MQIISESHGVVPLILKKFLKLASVYAAVMKDAVAGLNRRRSGSGAVGFTGRLCCFWSQLFVREEIQT
jgi:hypothetical protein